MNPLALMVKAPNIGGIVAQNEAAQAQVNDNALVRQLNLAKVQAAQQQLSDLFKTGKIDPYSDQGIAQIASIDAEAAKPYMDLYSEKLKNTREDAKLKFEERKTNAQEENYNNLIQTRTANTSSMISDRRASRMLAEMRFDREQTKAALDARKGLTEQNRAALLDYAAAVNAVPEAERAAAVPLIKEQIARVHGADTVDDLPDYDPNTNRVIQAVAAISAPKSGASTQTKETTEQKETGKLNAKQRAAQSATADAAEATINSANLVIDALNRGYITGKVESYIPNISTEYGVFKEAANQLTLKSMESIKGAASEGDRKVVEQSMPSEAKTVAANKEGAARLIAYSRRAQEREAFNDAWVEQNGTFSGANVAWNKFINEKPIFDRNGNVLEQNIDSWTSYINNNGNTPQGSMQQAPQAGGQAPQGVISFEDFMGQQ